MAFLNKLKKVEQIVKDVKDNLTGDRDVLDEAANMSFFHGRLKVRVIAAQNLPDTDNFMWGIDKDDLTDAYVTGDLGGARLFKTRYISNDLNPVWDESFNVYVCHHAASFELRVKDKEHVGAVFVAGAVIPAADLESGEEVEGWFDLLNGEESCGQIHISVQYIAKKDLDEETHELDSYFQPRENCKMILYQDADTPQLPQFESLSHPDGSPYEATRAWKDLFESIKNAQKFIYITGWSVYTAIQLLRGDEDPEGFSYVGELLKTKADEGVRVLMMVWNEKLSTEATAGLMGTHDEETYKFFEGSAVECIVVPRSKTDGILSDNFVGTMYTHHQKTVICDAPLEEDEGGLRRIIAFIGGLDITDGRYDTPEFHLFKTLSTLHKGDFYNNCIVGSDANVGPRQPWHDIHARCEGPIALDIMKNFEERWSKQGSESISRLYQHDESEFALDAPAHLLDQDGGPWTIQLFRSITSDSCNLDLDRHSTLHSKGGRLVENSIANCMIRQIRNAKKFIYMENQYFLGSAYSWLNDHNTLSHNLIPREITQKIIEKIELGETFKCYITIPMFPEGDPSSVAIQEILFWQFRTMETMYKRIAQALEGQDGHPTDYLSFYCLAKRESPDEVPTDELAEPEPGTTAELLRQTLRHCIYVHCKMSIFDDEYIICGSANINQRSLGGNRDTEIAVGGFQPEHTVEVEDDPRGAVHSFRQALWAAHLGGTDESFANPGSEECLARVREISQNFWTLYTADEPEHSDVHLLPYPIQVDHEGNVAPLEAPWDVFPDTTAPVMGAKSGYLPGKLTT